jgi:hypothetical protein
MAFLILLLSLALLKFFFGALTTLESATLTFAVFTTGSAIASTFLSVLAAVLPPPEQQVFLSKQL